MKDSDLLAAFASKFDLESRAELDFAELTTQETDCNCFDNLYPGIQLRFPRLFEKLILSYRWNDRVGVGGIRLVANPPGTDFSGLLKRLCADKFMWEFCLQSRFLQVGFGPDLCYDPLCFDFRKTNDCDSAPLVLLDHEQILCNSRIKGVRPVAENFRKFVLGCIE